MSLLQLWITVMHISQLQLEKKKLFPSNSTPGRQLTCVHTEKSFNKIESQNLLSPPLSIMLINLKCHNDAMLVEQIFMSTSHVTLYSGCSHSVQRYANGYYNMNLKGYISVWHRPRIVYIPVNTLDTFIIKFIKFWK